MSLVLSVYSTNAFKEYLLPAINNANSSIVLSKLIFDLEQDIEILLEVLDSKWYFLKTDKYDITLQNEVYFNKPLTNGTILMVNTDNEKQISIFIKETEKYFSVYEKFDISSLATEITIGKNENNSIVYDALGLISRNHATFFKKGSGYILEDTSSNGIFVNNKRVRSRVQLDFGDCIDVYGMRIIFMGKYLAINTNDEKVKVNRNVLENFNFSVFENTDMHSDKKTMYLYHRSPRHIAQIENEEVEIEGPPTPKELNQPSLAMTIGPAMSMALPMILGCGLAIYSIQKSGNTSSAFMYTGLITAVTSALLGTFWSVKNLSRAKKKYLEEENKRNELYSNYLKKCDAKIKEKYIKNTIALNAMYRPAEECIQYNEQNTNLWNRNTTHSDFIMQRLGMGEIPFQVPIIIPKEKFTMISDNLAELPSKIKNNYKNLKNVPICVDLLKEKLIGVIGGKNKDGAISMIHSLTAQIAANNCYTDVKMLFVYDEKENDINGRWNFAKWIPHTWNEGKNFRYVAKNKQDASDIFFELTNVLRVRAERSEINKSNNTIPKPYYILIIENQNFLEGELISKYIFDCQEEYGLTTLILVENYEDLPNECECILENSSSFSGVYHICDDLEDRVVINFDRILPGKLENFARTISRIEVKEAEAGGDIPNTLSFFEMYGAKTLQDLSVLDRWRKNRTYDNIKALVGQKAGNVPCFLDVHEKYHGPHGLIAGTTGSGKSETLQTYILSLAINFSPDDIGFFIIDYKGGGMANLFEKLPHVIGQISNLSGNQVRRAMVSIKSENIRRQRIFNEYGVNNINNYTRLYKNNEATLPIPHMFIIIDEFAELKREEPDFMRELISVAQVGRSLGVHLILATQKPSGTVDDNIWSNSKFRLCLRVQDRQDSNDMLHKTDAAYITQAGRCYLQVGNDELYELFQSGFSGAEYSEDNSIGKNDIAKMISINGKPAIIGNRTKIKQKETEHINWILSITSVLSDVIQSHGCDLSECRGNGVLQNEIISQTFESLMKYKIDYPASENNIKRMADFLCIYLNVMSGSGSMSEEETVRKIMAEAELGRKKLPEIKEKTQLDAVVEYLDKIAKSNGYVNNLQLWLPVLPVELYLEDLSQEESNIFDGNKWPVYHKKWTLEVEIGLYDDPVNQAQAPLTINLAENGNHAVCGTVVSGKSTFLQTFIFALINKYSPEEINVYLIDFSVKMLAPFEGAPHVGGIMFENDDEKLDKFFTMMEQIIEQRKTMFRGGNYAQFVQVKEKIEVPAIVIAIDNFSNFKAKTNSKFDNLIIQIAKEGVGYGIFLVISAAGFGINEIPSRIADNLRTVITLSMNDKFQYCEVLRNNKIDVLPENDVKGRGLANVGGTILEFQTALALKAPDDFSRAEKIHKLCVHMCSVWTGAKAKAIPEIPEKPVWDEFDKLEEYNEVTMDDRSLPIGYDSKRASIYSIDLCKNYCYIISGKARTGKTNLLKAIMHSAKHKGSKLVLIDFNVELEVFSQAIGARYISTTTQLHEFCSELIPEFKQRNGYRNSLKKEGVADEEIYVNMLKYERICIFVADFPNFIKLAYKPGEGITNASAFIENIIDKGALHNVYWFACYNQDMSNEVIGKKIYDNFIKDKTGIHFGGNVAAQRLFQYDYIPYLEQSRTMKSGIGLLSTINDESEVAKVVVPLVRG